MRKILLTLLGALALASLIALPFLCTHSSMLPDAATKYYEQKAVDQAQNATGAEAELMALLLGMAPAPAPAAEEEFSLSFSYYGLWLALGAVLSLALLFGRRSRMESALRPAVAAAALLSLPMGLLGGRLIYCLCNLPFYVSDISAPEAMLYIWEGGLSLAGALLLIALVIFLCAKLWKVSAGKMLDHFTPSLLLFAALAFFASALEKIGFGPEFESALPLLSISVQDSLRLNTAFFTGLFLLALCVLSLFMQKKPAPGPLFARFALFFGAGMILLESLRRDGHMLWGFVHAEMAFDLLIALASLLFLCKSKKKKALAFLATLLFAGAVIGLEFALDRSSIGDIWLYLVYFVSVSAYIWLGCSCAKQAKGI